MSATRSRIQLVTVAKSGTDAKSRRISYLTGRALAQAFKCGDLSAQDVHEYEMEVRAAAAFADFLAGYRDGIDFYDVNRTGASWDDLARLYYAAKGILPSN